jgi:hypothetical protein
MGHGARGNRKMGKHPATKMHANKLYYAGVKLLEPKIPNRELRILNQEL